MSAETTAPANNNVTELHHETPAAKLVNELRSYFKSGATRSYEWRLQQIKQLLKLLDEKEDEFMQALMEDSGKAEFTTYSGDIILVRSEAKHAIKHLKKWMKPRKVGTPMMLKPGKSYIRPEPLGTVLIIGAWNFPLQLTLGPLVGALAAGNTALLKPSEISPRLSALLTKWVPQYFDSSAVKVMEGGIEETTDILNQRFDKILYTGNSHVGKIIMQAAAKHLTPVTLELGGKNPVIVDKDANLDATANRIADVKFFNAGQVCVSADYLLVHEAVYDEFLPLLKSKIAEFFGPDPKTSNAYSRIVNERHVQRLKKMLDSGTAYVGGEVDESINYIAPTVLVDVAEDSPVMQDEIFGPILPVFKYKTDEEAIAFYSKHELPLAFYVFTENQETAQKFLDNSNSGAASINAIMMHASNHNLPFGGVGHSGMDAYHGKYSFEGMSHMRSVLERSTKVDPRGTYPPFTDKDVKMRKKITKWLMG